MLREIMQECRKKNSKLEARHKPNEALLDCNLYLIHQRLADQDEVDERILPPEAHIVLKSLSLNLSVVKYIQEGVITKR